MRGWSGEIVSLLTHTSLDRCPTCQHAHTTGFWLMVGFLGQAVFTARFLTQWVASERRRESFVPVAFWWLSLAGGLLLLAYAIHREDPVIVVGQALGVFIYLRNLALVSKARRRNVKVGVNARQAQQVRTRPGLVHARTNALTMPWSGSAMEPTLKRLRFDQDHAPNTPPSSFQPLFARLRARNDVL